MIRYAASLGVFLATASLAGCSSGEALTGAEAGVKQFHARLNAGRFDEIYRTADPRFRASSAPADFAAFIGAVRRKLGKTASTSRTGFRVNYNTSGNTVELGYRTRFERGDATEQFVFAINGTTTALLGYNVQSRALVVN